MDHKNQITQKHLYSGKIVIICLTIMTSRAKSNGAIQLNPTMMYEAKLIFHNSNLNNKMTGIKIICDNMRTRKHPPLTTAKPNKKEENNRYTYTYKVKVNYCLYRRFSV